MLLIICIYGVFHCLVGFTQTKAMYKFVMNYIETASYEELENLNILGTWDQLKWYNPYTRDFKIVFVDDK